MAGGPAVRPRGTGADPREDAAGPARGFRRPLILGAAPAAPPARAHRLRATFLPLVAILATAACATGSRLPAPTAAASASGYPGTRLLYAARVEGPDDRHVSFRLAVAVAPPTRLRFEALGPTGATRLVLATDGDRAVALVVSERRFDSAAATPQALATWTGLPLGPAALVALLAGQAPCAAPSTDPCPNLHFEPAGAARAGEPGCSGTLFSRPGGEVLATIECAGGEGGIWPERIRIDLPGSGRSIELRRTDGPAAALLGDALFAPSIPAGFRQADLLSPTASGSLLEGDGGRRP